MATYDLYLESGPQKKKTLAHVLDLLGCVVQSDTADEAVAAAPDTIRAYLDFLGRHGEKLDASAKIETRIAAHNTDGLFSGQAIWPQDLNPLAPAIARRGDTPMVGRERELAELRRRLDRADSERASSLCTVLGPPGIGKSRVAREFLASVEGRAQAVEPASSTPPGGCRFSALKTYFPSPLLTPKASELLHQGACPLSANKHMQCSKLGPISAAILRLV